jgi:hypothetical protein
MTTDNSNEDLRKRHSWDPINHPLDGLLQDHDTVRKLAAIWRATGDPAVKLQAGKQLVQAIHNHSRVEEAVFYQHERAIDGPMVGHFEEEHLKVDHLIATLQGMTLQEPHAERLMAALLDMVLHHIDQEEKEFFPKLENTDMAPVGLEMQGFEANLVHMQAQLSESARQR